MTIISFPLQANSAFLPTPPILRSRPPRCAVEQPVSPRDQLYSLVTLARNRTQTSSQLNSLINTLESLSQTETASNPDLMGTWRNAYTSTPSTSSIIQRTVVSSAFIPRVEQIIHPDVATNQPSKVLNRVDLRSALGCILNVRAAVEYLHDNRLYIRFDRAWFEFETFPSWLGGRQLPTVIHVPYPVPFRLLGDKASGWLDITYLDSSMRISRGNRGSCFVLVRDNNQSLPLISDHLT